MASVNWEKATTQKAGAMRVHFGRSDRVERNHSNKDIDKSKSHLNVYIGAEDYVPMYEKVKARIREVDKKHPPKRDMGDRRITCVMLETPVPQEVAEKGKAEEFLRLAHRTFEDFFGTENVGGTCGHFDEQHLYIKDGKEQMSLIHGHTLVAAFAEWRDKKTGEQRIGINGKNCMTKARFSALNNAIDRMCQEHFGVAYLTGEKGEHGRTVEELKARQGLEKIKKENDDFVQSITPSTTKKVKGIFGEKEVAKTEDELQQDKQILAAQAVLQREQDVAQKEEQQTRMATKIAAAQRELSEKSKALSEERKALEIEKKSLETEKKNFAKAVLIQARQLADKIMRSMGFKPNKGYDINNQINTNLQQERSMHNEHDHNH